MDTKTKRSTKTKRCNKIMAYCVTCKNNVEIQQKTSLIKRKIPNGNTVSILCGKCTLCKNKVCKIIANSSV